MNSFKRFSGIFLYSVFIIFIFLCGENYRVYLRVMTGRTFNPVPLYTYMVVFPVVIGLLLAVPHLFHELKKRGSWKYDWVKFLAVAIPALYILLSLPLKFISFFRPMAQFLYPDNFYFTIIMQPTTLNFVGIAVGYFALAVLYKEAVSNTDVEV